jgi:hypothetical protein
METSAYNDEKLILTAVENVEGVENKIWLKVDPQHAPAALAHLTSRILQP